MLHFIQITGHCKVPAISPTQTGAQHLFGSCLNYKIKSTKESFVEELAETNDDLQTFKRALKNCLKKYPKEVDKTNRKKWERIHACIEKL